MPEERARKVEKWNTLGSAISVWGKLLIALLVFVFTVGTAWYQIETNATINVRQDEQFKEMLHTITREFEIWGERSDKRYERTMKEFEERKEVDLQQSTEILELTKELYYIKGKLDEQDKHK